MLELYVDRKLADWNVDTSPITFCKEFNNETDELSKSESVYSYEIDLPATITNNAIFGYKSEIDVNAKFSDVHQVEVYDGGVQLFQGNLLVNKITKDTYSCNLYKPGTKPLSDIFGEKKLSDITQHQKYVGTLDDIRHTNNYHIGEVEAEDYDDKHIVFPYILYNLPMNPKNATTRKDYQVVGATTLINDENSYPAFNLQSVIKDLFHSYGFEVQGNFFTDKEFENLYQTVKNDKWNGSERETPCYLELKINQYKNALSPTSMSVDDPNYSMRIGFDHLLGSAVTVLNDQNQMMPADNSFISVPKTGWYRVEITGDVKLSNTHNARYTNEERGMQFPSSNCDGDPSNFAYNPLEIRLTKETDNVGYLSKAMGEFAYTEDGLNIVRTWSKGESENKRLHNFISNNGVLKVIDQDLIVGARFGSYRGHEDSDLATNRKYFAANVLNLINPSNVTEDRYHVEVIGDSTHDQYDVRWNTSHYFGGNWVEDITYGSDTAFAFVGKNVIFNPKDTTQFNCIQGTFTTQTYPTQWEHLAYNNVTTSDAYNGHLDLNVLGFLKKGEILKLDLSSPFTNASNNNSGMAQVEINNLKLKLGLLNREDEYWTPTSGQTFQINERKTTNVNRFLGDDKCKEWVENICNTFNLKVSRTGTNTYSIDRKSVTSLDTNVIGFDDHAHPSDATFKRIETPTAYNFKWTIDTNEEGYTSTGKDGGKTYTNSNNTTGDEVEIESKYSYNWFKTIEFEEIGNRQVPIICPSKRWTETYTYEKALSDGDWTEGTPRLIYVPTNSEMVSNAYLPLLLADTTELDFDTISKKFFNVVFSTQYEVEIECYLPQSKWASIVVGTRARFNDNLYTISKIDGYDVGLDNPCRITLRSIK